MLNKFLFKQIDNSALIVYRFFFGIIIACEGFGAILTGWVKHTFIDAKFTFNFIGLEFLQPLPGNGMYFYFALMGVLGILIAIGYRFRASILAFSILWSGVYLMQKTSYNNHYYLFALLSWILVFLPAEKYASLDVKRNPKIKSISMPAWVKWFIVAQLFIVYTYASIAKMYPDWLDLTVPRSLFINKAHYPIVGELFQQNWFHAFIAYSGILFDLLIIPLLLWKPTRKFAFAMAIFFHLFNSFVFHIGIFPYLAILLCIFFFDEKTIRNIFLKRKEFYDKGEAVTPKNNQAIKWIMGIYLLIQVALPLRHHFIKGNVLWTEEGHRLSWRMMLRSRSGYATFTVVDKKTKQRTVVKLSEYLTPKQQRKIGALPDFMWQFAQRLKQEYKAKGQDIEVYVKGKARVNNSKSYVLIDPTVDLASVKWNQFTHNPWVKIYPKLEKYPQKP